MMLDRIVEVFCEVDDFCQAFVPQWEASLIVPGGPPRRGPEPGLSPSEIITLLLVFHSSGFKYLKSFYHGFAEPLATFPACPAMSTSSPCRKVPSCRWCSSSSATWEPGPGSITSTPPPLRHPSHQPAQGLRRSGPARQDLDGLVLRLQAAPRLQHRH